ncbi:molybdenum hydroxylase [Lachnoclostridium sp. An169]|uniref:selenium-dependent molybdenum cofactor biosynthesis protein YqeB n=1 Tax=Lachnoclostridium sp. An169 TaxID=1965569 RepID=UPI000B38D21D|nr:selenium-dependent molybdenum cofactor biosynthesis protein YqeB [Lachnoclostridium sp. An169]OUP85733.1 molybdenum hydroxylase [Lachnoclostridium sp. An169]HJA65091.1 EF2563 family selenium-dependent molybdenum hydroxylase system protein [Candidatus Mediterraneibacter cottocaccae]
MKILIRGAGDLATGIASRLYGAGHTILMTEIGEPLTVRRTVALSRAVYEGRARIEEMEGFLAGDEAEAWKIMERGDVAVMVDPGMNCRGWFRPDVIVDAILAKRNLGTRIDDAPFVVGVGPGFAAGEDCNCVVETKRGHTLGNIIWRGSAIPNTGVPGNVGGYTIERLIRAAADGKIEPCVQIGDYVEKGQTVAFTGGVPVYAQMSGIVRGMLQEGAQVQKNLKIGDIDARTEVSHCHTISDKARAIGGGVLEAVTGFERMKGRFAIVILAAGAGSRFGGDKLGALVKNKPLYMHTLERMKGFGSFPAYVVTGSGEIAEQAEKLGIVPVWNREPELGISRSLNLGLARALGDAPDLEGVLFSVCDQPGMSASTIQQIFNTGARHPGAVVCAGNGSRCGNPVLWDRKYFPELMELSGDRGGRQVMKRHAGSLKIVQADPEELKDIDRREDLS